MMWWVCPLLFEGEDLVQSALNLQDYPMLFVLTSGELLAAIEKDFGSYDKFKEQLTAKTVAVQGSGWGWLVSHM